MKFEETGPNQTVVIDLTGKYDGQTYIFFIYPRIFLEQKNDIPSIFLAHECIFYR